MTENEFARDSEELARREQRNPNHHETEVYKSTMSDKWWWKCSCADEGGPFDSETEASNSAIDHEWSYSLSKRNQMFQNRANWRKWEGLEMSRCTHDIKPIAPVNSVFACMKCGKIFAR